MARNASMGVLVGPAEADAGGSGDAGALAGGLAPTLGEGTTCDPCPDGDPVAQPTSVSAVRTMTSERADGCICRQR
jgi:hypothetical protein